MQGKGWDSHNEHILAHIIVLEVPMNKKDHPGGNQGQHFGMCQTASKVNRVLSNLQLPCCMTIAAIAKISNMFVSFLPLSHYT